MASTRIKYKNYPFILTIKMKVDRPTRIHCLDGTMKAHVRRKKRVVLHFYFHTLEEQMSFYENTKKKLQPKVI